ncbi:hypothetical protein C8R47DRAFT_1157793 [Mycena vitilis]|nr:hypothetical protein C8R47DRAFT_1161436 [Mycena vitilis]KAJ6463161.1 hypothetical protein C8R47DRAFT_1157793 [Mycena vitilis]
MHPALYLDKLSALAVPVRRFATAAMNGSLVDMDKVTNRILMQPDVSSRFLPVIHATLDPSRIPDTDLLDTGALIPETVLPLAMALRSIHALTLIQDVPPVVCAELWPRVWRWMQVIETYRSLLSPSDPVECTLRCCVLNLLQHDEPAIYGMPEMHAFFARMWAGLDLDCGDQTALNVGMSSLLIFMRTSQWKSSNLDEFVDGCGGTAALAALTVRHIHAAIEPYSPHPSPLRQSEAQWLVGMLTFVRAAAKSQLLQPLCTAGIVRALVQAFFPLCDTITSGTKRDGIEDALDACLESLATAISAPGYFFLPEALDAGLLRILLVLEQCRSDKVAACRHFHRFLQEILPGALIFLPVVSAVRGKAPSMDVLRTSQHLDVWTVFNDLVTERVRLLDEFQSPEYTPTQGCDGPKCGLIKPMAEIKRCAGCLTHFYCSIQCQTAAWRDGGHRAVCKPVQDLHRRQRPASVPFRRRDEAFTRFIVLRDYRANKLDILLKQLAFVHRTKSTNFSTVFNYLQGNCTINVIPLEEASRGGLAEREYRPGMIHQTCLPAGRCDCECVPGSDTHDRTIERILHMRAESSVLMDGVVRVAGMLPEGVDFERLGELWPDLFEEVRALSELEIEETHG